MKVKSKWENASQRIFSPRCNKSTFKFTGPKVRQSPRRSPSPLRITIKPHQYRIENTRAPTEDPETKLKARRPRTLNKNKREDSDPERKNQLLAKEKKKLIKMQKKMSNPERTHRKSLLNAEDHRTKDAKPKTKNRKCRSEEEKSLCNPLSRKPCLRTQDQMEGQTSTGLDNQINTHLTSSKRLSSLSIKSTWLLNGATRELKSILLMKQRFQPFQRSLCKNQMTQRITTTRSSAMNESKFLKRRWATWSLKRKTNCGICLTEAAAEVGQAKNSVIK